MIERSIHRTLQLFTLAAFAFAQPLYDLLGKNAEFFAVRDKGVSDIFLLVLFLSIGLPAAIALAVRLAALAGKRSWLVAQVGALSCMFAIAMLPVISKIPAINMSFTIGFSFVFAALFAYLYLRWQATTLFLTYLSPAILIFPLLFLFNSPVYHLIFPEEPPPLKPLDISAETNIVMIVFDELPVSTLMSERNTIDATLFPGFAAFAENATWYPNTTTVAEYTIQAIPAILTGRLPSTNISHGQPKHGFTDHFDIPAYRHHPENLFTALSKDYELRVFETVSDLCPDTLCADVYDRDIKLKRRIGELASDIYMVYLHATLPRWATRELPRIDMNWNDFVLNNFEDIAANMSDDDVRVFKDFISSLTPNQKPTLYFHHTKLPHGPWKYLPTGRQYNASNYAHAFDGNQVWDKNANIREPYQRHLLQTIFADSLLMQVIDKLKREDLYDDAIIIVTADHGASFLPGEGFRMIHDKNYPDIIEVPLLIKGVGQKQGIIDTTHMRTVDIVPMLFDELGETYPWATDGRATRDEPVEVIKRLEIVTREGEVKQLDYDADDKLATVNTKSKILGVNDRDAIYAGPEYAHLIGGRLADHCSRTLNGSNLIGNEKYFRNIENIASAVPASLKILSPFDSLNAGELLIVTLNQRIAAVIDEEPKLDRDRYFYTMIDDRYFQTGANVIELHALTTNTHCNQGSGL